MITYQSIVLRLRALFRRRHAEREMDDEFRFHLEMETEAMIRRGVDPAEARTRAMRSFGGVERFREESRDARGVRALEDLGQDLRYAVRVMAKAPGFTAVAVLTLALGIGANTAIFSVVNGVLLRPLPWGDADRLVAVWENDRFTGTEREASSIPDARDFRERVRSFAGLTMFAPGEANLTNAGAEPQRVSVAGAEPALLPLMGVQPVVGRWFDDTEDGPGAPAVAVVAEEMWRARFDADPAVIGSTLTIDERPFTIVGVVPASFDFPRAETQLWVPLRYAVGTDARVTHNVGVIARLAPGVSFDAAQAEIGEVAGQLETEYAQANSGRGASIEPVTEVLFARIRPALLVLLGAVALVLLIACANVANLLLARGASRAREVAVRAAMGASRGRLTRQFLVEGLVLTLVAAVLGVAMARFGLGRLLALVPADLPRADGVGIDGRVLAATIGVSIAVGLLFGMIPAMQSRRVDLQDSLKGEGGRAGTASRARTGFRSMLVVAELALSVMLVIGAGLMIRSFVELNRIDPGFRPHNLLKAEFQLPGTRYPRDYSRFPNFVEINAFYDRVIEEAKTLPGVEAAAIAGQHPLAAGFTNSFVIEGREAEVAGQSEIPIRPVSPDYLRTAGVQLVRGRPLEATDRADAPAVLLINEAGAKKFFPDTDPIGQRIRFWGSTREIVGIVRNERFHGLAEEEPPAIYPPIWQTPMAAGSILLRTGADPLASVTNLRAAVKRIDPDIALYAVETMDQALAQSLARERFTMLLLGVFAGAALLLAVIGVHGVLSYTVAQRAHEVGIRVALGATRSSVVGLVVRQGLGLALLGISIGLAGAWAGSRVLATLLYGVTTTDAATFAGVTVLMVAVAAFACWLPARRASGIDPMAALRSE